MYTLIIGVIVGIIIGGLIGKKLSWENDKTFWSIFKGMSVGSLIGLLIGLTFGLIIYSVNIDHTIPTKLWEKDIKSLGDNSSVSGSFFLGCGTIDKRDYYYYYVKAKNGGWEQKRLETDLVTIFEDQDSTAYIRCNLIKISDDHWSHNWAIKHHEEYEIHIPAGSIKNSFDLDLK